jgi:general secretion pathway protein J
VAARRDNGGFTLLEMVVAMTLVAAMAGILAVAFRMASASTGRGGDVTRQMARLRAGIAVVERALRSADAMPLATGDKPVPYFRGERTRLRFLSACPPSAASGGGLRLLSLFGSESAGLALADASPFRVDGADGWEGRDGARPILPGATEIAFSYSAGPGKDGAWEWDESWDAAEKGALPAAVRVELITADAAGGTLKTAFVVPVFGGG